MFLAGLSRQYSRNRFNLYGRNKIHKIYNDRVILNEDKKYLDSCININKPTMDQYIKDNNCSDNLYKLDYCSRSYRLVRFTFDYGKQYIKNLPHKLFYTSLSILEKIGMYDAVRKVYKRIRGQRI
jgi:hypothetical protein